MAEHLERATESQLGRTTHELLQAQQPSYESDEFEEMNELLSQINTLQREVQLTTNKVSDHETLIMNKELENLELRHRISSLESSLKARQSPTICKCAVF